MDGHVRRLPRRRTHHYFHAPLLLLSDRVASALLLPLPPLYSNVVKPYINPLLEKFGKGEDGSKE